MEELLGFGMKKVQLCRLLQKLIFLSLRNENDEAIHTHNDEFLRCFVRQSNKGGRFTAVNQYYKPSISDKVFNIISQELSLR